MSYAVLAKLETNGAMNNHHQVTKSTKQGMKTVVVKAILSFAHLLVFVLFVSLW